MKILFMTPDGSNDISWSNVDYLEKAIGKIAKCKWAGPRHKLFDHKENLNDTITRVMPDADWVIVSDSAQDFFPIKIPRKRLCKVAYLTSDLHYPSPRKQLKKFNKGKWDVFLMHVTGTNFPVDDRGTIDAGFFIRHLNAPIANIAFSINPNLFKPLPNPKKYDVAFLGGSSKRFYPLRHKIRKHLPKLAEQNKWKILIKGRPPGQSFSHKREISQRLKTGSLVGYKYAEALASSKILIFGTIKNPYPVKKYFEGMACGTCILANMPLSSKELHFHPNRNFVRIKMKNWKDKLKYYLEHDEEREEIAKRGYETVMKYHTNDIRAKQIVTFLEKYK